MRTFSSGRRNPIVTELGGCEVRYFTPLTNLLSVTTQRLRILGRIVRLLVLSEPSSLACICGLTLTGLYPSIATWLSKQIVDALATAGVKSHDMSVSPLVIATAYGI